MAHRLLLYAAAALAVLLIAAAPLLAYDVPDKIVIERPANYEKLNSWVTKVNFTHGAHAIRVSCNQCHHKESDKTLGKFVPCTQCHKSDDPTDESGFYRAWHSDGPQLSGLSHADAQQRRQKSGGLHLCLPQAPVATGGYHAQR